ncbi:MAG: hypothetical protein ABW318_02070 [Vicinamibacterales bacterium]
MRSDEPANSIERCLLAALGNTRPSRVGASMGGGTSLVAVGEGHVDASALVLVDIAPRILNHKALNGAVKFHDLTYN